MAHRVRVLAGNKTFTCPDPTVTVEPGYKITFQEGSLLKPIEITVQVSQDAPTLRWVGRDCITTFTGWIVDAESN